MTTPDSANLVYDVAHDLQTPLTALKAQLYLITEAQQTGSKLETCHEIIDSMSSMVSDLLAYARSGESFDEKHRKHFDLSERINEALEYVGTVARSCKVNIKHSIEPNLIIDGVPEKIDEAFLNLVSNSMKYLRSSGRRNVVITLSKQKKECILCIEDTGIGIPADELPHVFTRFYRTRPATQHASGSGLGLAITKKIVELHDGTVGIESTEGVGTKVEIRIPLVSKRSDPHDEVRSQNKDAA